jgi:hypothetical protein
MELSTDRLGACSRIRERSSDGALADDDRRLRKARRHLLLPRDEGDELSEESSEQCEVESHQLDDTA